MSFLFCRDDLAPLLSRVPVSEIHSFAWQKAEVR
jgi:hypothetical protein